MTILSDSVARFTIYVTGETTRSLRAISNLRALLDMQLPNEHELEIVDITKQPELAAAERIIATPMVLRSGPSERRVIGDLSDLDLAAKALGLGAVTPGR